MYAVEITFVVKTGLKPYKYLTSKDQAQSRVRWAKAKPNTNRIVVSKDSHVQVYTREHSNSPWVVEAPVAEHRTHEPRDNYSCLSEYKAAMCRGD
jgi:hypothetical protein